MWGSRAAPRGPLRWGAWLGLGCWGRGFGRSGDGLLTAPTRAARALPPSWTWSCSLGWGSEGRAEGDQDPQVGGEGPALSPELSNSLWEPPSSLEAGLGARLSLE